MKPGPGNRDLWYGMLTALGVMAVIGGAVTVAWWQSRHG